MVSFLFLALFIFQPNADESAHRAVDLKWDIPSSKRMTKSLESAASSPESRYKSNIARLIKTACDTKDTQDYSSGKSKLTPDKVKAGDTLIVGANYFTGWTASLAVGANSAHTHALIVTCAKHKQGQCKEKEVCQSNGQKPICSPLKDWIRKSQTDTGFITVIRSKKPKFAQALERAAKKIANTQFNYNHGFTSTKGQLKVFKDLIKAGAKSQKQLLLYCSQYPALARMLVCSQKNPDFAESCKPSYDSSPTDKRITNTIGLTGSIYSTVARKFFLPQITSPDDLLRGPNRIVTYMQSSNTKDVIKSQLVSRALGELAGRAWTPEKLHQAPNTRNPLKIKKFAQGLDVSKLREKIGMRYMTAASDFSQTQGFKDIKLCEKQFPRELSAIEKEIKQLVQNANSIRGWSRKGVSRQITSGGNPH